MFFEKPRCVLCNRRSPLSLPFVDRRLCLVTLSSRSSLCTLHFRTHCSIRLSDKKGVYAKAKDKQISFGLEYFEAAREVEQNPSIQYSSVDSSSLFTALFVVLALHGFSHIIKHEACLLTCKELTPEEFLGHSGYWIESFFFPGKIAVDLKNRKASYFTWDLKDKIRISANNIAQFMHPDISSENKEKELAQMQQERVVRWAKRKRGELGDEHEEAEAEKEKSYKNEEEKEGENEEVLEVAEEARPGRYCNRPEALHRAALSKGSSKVRYPAEFRWMADPAERDEI